MVLDTDPGGPVTVMVGDDTTTTPGVNDLDKVRVQPGGAGLHGGELEHGADGDGGRAGGRRRGGRHSVAGARGDERGHGDYAGLAVAAVAVTVTDNDVPGLTVSTTALAVDEPGTATYSVRLNTEPGGAVTVGIADTTNNADVSTDPSGTGALEFTTASWETAQTVTVTVAADDDAADDTATLAHTVEGTGDTTGLSDDAGRGERHGDGGGCGHGGRDGERDGLGAGPEEHATDGSGTYTVVLDTQPTAPVTVTVVLDHAADCAGAGDGHERRRGSRA